ncbi:peptidoglycan-binding protein [Candidatus Kaiserbacteria bacterium]|nr:peptidoglycan-binding protein [Candidatus Kaiserbacteria bacterium]
MLKKITFAGVGIALLASPLLASADMVSDLQAQIQALMAQVAALQGQLNPAPATPVGPTDDYGTTQTTPACPNLSVTMQRGARDATTGGQVIDLQTFLADYFNLPEEGLVTGYFGKNTEAAVIRFQNQYSLPAFGIVGSLTRAKIAGVCGGGAVLQPGPVCIAEALRTACPTGQHYESAGPDTIDANGCRHDNLRCVPDSTSTATFSAAPMSGQAPLNVTFTIGEAKPGVTYNFSYGDGATGSATCVQDGGKGDPRCGAAWTTAHTYASAGTYTATLSKQESYSCPPGAYCPMLYPAPVTVGTVTITVTGNPTQTLVITDVQYSPAHPHVNDLITTTVTIMNKSSSDRTTTFQVNVGGTTVDVPYLAAVTSRTVIVPNAFTFADPGQKTLHTHLINPLGGGLGGTIDTYTNTLTFDAGSNSSGVTITAPNGGEQWETGITNTVTWTPYQYNPDINPSRDVTAFLETKNSDGSFNIFGRVEESGKASIHWVTGQLYAASQSNNFIPQGPGYYIRVVNNVTGAWDRSDAPFTILPRSVDVKVDGSDGPLTIDPSQKVWVEWTSTNKTSCTLYGVMDSLTSTQTYIGNLPTSGKREVYVWFYDPSSGTTISAQCVDAAGNVVTDWVVINPTSQPAAIRITSPNGGEQISIGSEYVVRTSYSGVSAVSVALYKNDQWMKWLYKDVPVSSSPHDWYWTPSTEEAAVASQGSVFKIYATGQRTDGTGYVDDKSDAPFSFSGITVSPPTCSISGTPGNEVVSGTGGYNLSWVTTNASTANLTGGAMNLNTGVPVTGNPYGQPTQMWVSQPGTYTLTVTGTYGLAPGGGLVTGTCSTTVGAGVLGGTDSSSGTNAYLASALSALESALKALISKLGQ